MHDFDIIVIGSGAGGGVFARACADAGKRVLLLEKGRRATPQDRTQDEDATLIEKSPYDDQPVRINGQPRRLYAGGVFGGGTALYGAALLRPSPDDFHPGRFYGERLARPSWDWPIDYTALEPFYAQAETLYGVAGANDDNFGPLGRPASFPGEPLDVEPINRRLMDANLTHGLKPFRLPLAIDRRRCLHCGTCAGYVCPNDARRSAGHLAEGHVEVMTGVEAESFTRDGAGQVDGVRVRERATGETSQYRARRYALAAGALSSPLLLLRSGLDGPLVGRHYMFHLSPIVAGVFWRPTGGEARFIKQVGFADYYFGGPGYAHKLGLIQSLPVPGPLMLAKSAGKRLPRFLLDSLRRRMLPLTGIIEDLPNPANRVTLGNDGQADLEHAFSPYDLERGQQLGQLMKQILKRAGALFCLTKTTPSEEHVAHQCGTLRMGHAPADGVVDADCRLFGKPNVFVVDGSVMPTSLGVGPALTISANALRVAQIAAREI